MLGLGLAVATLPAAADDVFDALLGNTPESAAQAPAEAGSEPEQQAVPVIPVSDANSQMPEEQLEPRRRRGPMVEEIIVTAQKREESINDVSISISAFSGEDLSALGITDTRDMSNLVPGFRYAESGYNTPVYSLRGVGFNEASQTASATVGVYVDEVNLPFAIMSKGANLDVERVEVLKGPQGTLYGRNTTGGAINYIANKPTELFESAIKASYGSFQTTDVEGYVSGPLSDTVSARFALRDIRSQEGWQHSVSRYPGGDYDTLGELDKQSARFTLDWNASDDVDVALTLSGWRDYSEPQAPQAIGLRPQNAVLGNLYASLGLDRNLALAPSVRNQPLVPRNGADPQAADWSSEMDFQLRDTFYSGALRTDWAVTPDMNLVWLSAYHRFQSDGTTIPQSGLGVTAGERAMDVTTDAYSTELRLDGQWDDVNWLIGAFYSHDDVNELQDLFLGGLSTGFPTPAEPVLDLLQDLLGIDLPLVGNVLIDRALFEGQQTADSYAVFGNAGWQFAEAFKLNLGLRYTYEKRSFYGCTRDNPENSEGVGIGLLFSVLSLSRGGNGNTFDDGCISLNEETRDPEPGTGTLTEDNVSGRIALDWTPSPEWLIYAAYSRGFKSGSFPVLSASEQKQYEPVTQEQLDAWELGTKSTLWDGRLQLNGSTFYYSYRDKQLLGNLLDPIFGPLPLLVNAPKSRVVGAEIELQASPVPNLFLSAAASYLDTRVKEFIGTDENGDEKDFAGNRFNFAPRLEYTLLANYVYALTDRHDLSLGVDYSYTGETNSSLGGEPDFAHDDYFLINARLGLASSDGIWDVGLWGRNLTDELTTISIQKAADPFSRYVGMTRTYGVSFAYRFD